ncbi:MAG: glycerophosphodiester phosphodiesterase [Actinobacteria bacterium]|jgi:glycerophosphoryl diester phosphodiesterase|nr:glycerophosphodiester phosphodiesterase [Actinomycetota bacterium]MBT3746022.1 glycerophosphodiester phosphodiesterase [Actinomycetota bacterium]MBT3968876.1 glycerophosphodiester phosphodiesterase [Actinomycetota bacterium]MBT4008942.1 glycerophosphodiester phosphodiesterase [Actinomycetota bacterium]MBT4302431.1 glycerophosphodiester phosphodiesterase [Actinomycetota bacterium]
MQGQWWRLFLFVLSPCHATVPKGGGYGLGVTVLHPFLDHPRPLAFAHRGGAGDWPENTMPAFNHAAELGYRYIETDVHVTADGVVVAFHDDRLDRVTDQQGLIADLSWEQVQTARVDGREPIVLFSTLLTDFPQMRINIDPKDDAVVEPLAALLGEHDALDRVCVGAFSDRRINQLRSLLGPDLCTSAGPLGVARFRSAGFGLPFASPNFQCLQVPVSIRGVRLVDKRLVDSAHQQGLQVHVWTIDEATEMERLLGLGVDGIMTDRLSVLKQVLVAQGLWP